MKKSILVQFSDYGATIIKDPVQIEKLTGQPNCFLDPDLSKVYGVSPAYWTLNEYNKIIKCSEEEMQRRNTYHRTVVTGEKQTVEKVHISDLKKEFKDKFDQNEEFLMLEISRLKQEISGHNQKADQQLKELYQDLNRNKMLLEATKMNLIQQQVKNEKSHKKLAISVVLAIAVSVLIKLLLDQ